MVQRAAAVPEEPEDRFQRLLPRSNDLTMIVLKGHHLLEEVIDGYIAVHLTDPAALENGRFTFAQRICLARALAGPEIMSDWLDSALNLNTLRDRVSCHLEPSQLAHLIREFLQVQEAPNVPHAQWAKVPTATRLKVTLGFLCSAFYVGAEMFVYWKEQQLKKT